MVGKPHGEALFLLVLLVRVLSELSTSEQLRRQYLSIQHYTETGIHSKKLSSLLVVIFLLIKICRFLPNTQFWIFGKTENRTCSTKLSVLLRLWCIRDAWIDPSRQASTDEPIRFHTFGILLNTFSQQNCLCNCRTHTFLVRSLYVGDSTNATTTRIAPHYVCTRCPPKMNLRGGGGGGAQGL